MSASKPSSVLFDSASLSHSTTNATETVFQIDTTVDSDNQCNSLDNASSTSTTRNQALQIPPMQRSTHYLDAALQQPSLQSMKQHNSQVQQDNQQQVPSQQQQQQFSHSSSSCPCTSESTVKADAIAACLSSAENRAKINALILPRKPAFIEQFTSFYTSADIATIVDRLRKALEILNIEYEYDKQKMKLKCLSFNTSNASLTFCIRLYAVDVSQQSKIVEVQKRCGCSMQFNILFTRLTQQLADIIDKPYCTDSQPSTAREHSRNTTDSVSQHRDDEGSVFEFVPAVFDSSVCCDRELLSMLCTMSQTNDVSVQREAIQAISRCSFNENADDSDDYNSDGDCSTCPRQDQQDKVCNVLGDILKSNKGDTEQVRCVAVAIHALAAKCNSIRQKLLKKFSDSIYQTLEQVATTIKPCLQLQATKRHIIDALALCLETHKRYLTEYSHKTAAQWIHVILQCKELTADERLKHSFDRTLQQLYSLQRMQNNEDEAA